jgi:class 3 adenylate cyclase
MYAKAGDHHIAYREIVGDNGGDVEIVMVNGANFPMDSLFDDPIASRLVEGLADLGRLIMFDRRGIALSDPLTDWDTPIREQWADDLAAVITASGCDRPTVFSWEGSAVARDCSVRYPDLIGRLVLHNPRPDYTDEDIALREAHAAGLARVRAGRVPSDRDYANPGRAGDPDYITWNDAAGRAGASPRLAEEMANKRLTDPPFDHSRIRIPTLVITRTPGNSPEADEFVRRTVRQIPGAEHVELAYGDYFAVGADVDDILAVISQHLTGEVCLPPPERQLAVILFTDLVGSTRRAAVAGDAVWKRLLDRHDRVSRAEVSRRGGEVVKTTGDGVLALLPSATAAIEAARAIRAHLEDDDLQVRVGVHVGEIDRRGDDVSGLAVNTTARIMSTAEPGQILVSTVVTLTTSAASFASIGPQRLKDIEGTWELHSVD